MKIITDPKEVQDWCARQNSVGFVPTMGCLHDGHLSLVQRARRENDKVVVSIYVNPTQFLPGEDFDNYPRVAEDDCNLLSEITDVVFLPSDSLIYPFGKNAHQISEPNLSLKLCGASRPGHFDGVLLVVMKLLQLVQANRIYMGLKDFQQQLLISRMIQDFFLPTQLIACPTIRESDGLALSSRNKYLDNHQRTLAPKLYQALRNFTVLCKKLGPQKAQTNIKAQLHQLGFEVDYLQILDERTLETVTDLNSFSRIFVAAYLGKTRLIDNVGVKDV